MHGIIVSFEGLYYLCWTNEAFCVNASKVLLRTFKFGSFYLLETLLVIHISQSHNSIFLYKWREHAKFGDTKFEYSYLTTF